jgi:DNA-binding NtrC family response regulator
MILLVEDDEQIREDLDLFLQRAGFEVIGVGSVKDAEKCMAKTGIDKITAVISDIDLGPVSNELEGYSFFRRWTAREPELPFILISGDHLVWDLPAVRTKAACFLVKPFNPHDLIAAVQSALKEKLATGLILGSNKPEKPQIPGKEILK